MNSPADSTSGTQGSWNVSAPNEPEAPDVPDAPEEPVAPVAAEADDEPLLDEHASSSAEPPTPSAAAPPATRSPRPRKARRLIESPTCSPRVLAEGPRGSPRNS